MTKREMTSDEGRKVIEKAFRDRFHAGVIAALQVLALHDLESVWWQVVDTCDEKALRDFARRDDMYELAGFGKYTRR